MNCQGGSQSEEDVIPHGDDHHAGEESDPAGDPQRLSAERITKPLGAIFGRLARSPTVALGRSYLRARPAAVVGSPSSLTSTG
jgi:hypothetical protein